MEPDIRVIPGGPWDQRCYVVAAGGLGVVIDPGPPAAKVIAAAEDGGVRISAVVATHGHFDHIGAAREVCEHAGVPLVVSKDDARILRSANLHSFVTGWGKPVTVPKSCEDLDALGTTASIGGMTFQVLRTPGHTPGSRCLRLGSILFTGDTLLGRGKVDSGLPGADPQALSASLALLAELPADLRVLPGHGEGTSLGEALARV
jgi:hydroxyacylglutathione hydrolase